MVKLSSVLLGMVIGAVLVWALEPAPSPAGRFGQPFVVVHMQPKAHAKTTYDSVHDIVTVDITP